MGGGKEADARKLGSGALCQSKACEVLIREQVKACVKVLSWEKLESDFVLAVVPKGKATISKQKNQGQAKALVRTSLCLENDLKKSRNLCGMQLEGGKVPLSEGPSPFMPAASVRVGDWALGLSHSVFLER